MLKFQLNVKSESALYSHLNCCNTNKAVKNIVKHRRIISCNDVFQIQSLVFKNGMALLYGCSTHWQLQQVTSHAYPLAAHAREYKPYRALGTIYML